MYLLLHVLIEPLYP